MTVDFYQILYKEEQRAKLYPFATPYFNQTLTPFFENSVIAELVPNSTADKIAVCSWALSDKRFTFGSCNRYHVKIEDLLERDYDVASLTCTAPRHLFLEALEQWHKGAKELLRQICLEIGVPWVDEIKRGIYNNAFCARREIYQDYVANALKPAMEAMETKFKDQCWQDSGYYKLKNPGDDYAQRVKQFLGVDYCPLHPFILERLFSVWISTKNFNVIYV